MKDIYTYWEELRNQIENDMNLNEAYKILEEHGYNVQKNNLNRQVRWSDTGNRILEAFDVGIPEVPDNILEKVTQRTIDHIKRVKYFYNKLLKMGLIPKEYQNQSEVASHDQDKLIPKNLKRQSYRYYIPVDELTPAIEQEIQDVVKEHVKSNKHHCEYWGSGDHRTTGMDCSEMPLKYVYEMLADWAATAEERGGTVESWYKASVINAGGKRWSFSREANEEMENCIPYLDMILDKSLKRDYGLTFIDPAFLKKK